MKLNHITHALVLAGIIAATPLNAAPVQGGLEQRVQRLEKLLESQGLVDLYLRLENLQKEVQELRGSIEIQTNTLAGIKQRQRDLYLDVDRRLRQLESGAAAPQAVPNQAAALASGTTSNSSAPAATTASGVPATTVSDKVAEETAYRSAFKLLKEGRYAPATSRFRDFITKYPGSGYADNAQYWLGEISYVTRDFEQAIREFDLVLQKYPDSTKHADAMLKKGYCYYELKNYTKAHAVLDEVTKRFPATTAARLADKRRQRMKQEGH